MEMHPPTLASSRFDVAIDRDLPADDPGREYLTWQVLVDGEPLSGGTVDPGALLDSWHRLGWHQILTCGCSSSDCGDMPEGVYVSHDPYWVRWSLRDPYFPKGWREGSGLLRHRVLCFDRIAYWSAIQQAIENSAGVDWDRGPRRLWPYGFDWHRYVAYRFGMHSEGDGMGAEAQLHLPDLIEVGRWTLHAGSTLLRDVRSRSPSFEPTAMLHRDDEVLARWMQWQDCFDAEGHARPGLLEEQVDEVGLGLANAIGQRIATGSMVRYFPVNELRPQGRPALSCTRHVVVADRTSISGLGR